MQGLRLKGIPVAALLLLSACLVCIAASSCTRQPLGSYRASPTVSRQPAEEELEAIPEPVEGSKKRASEQDGGASSYVEEGKPPRVEEDDRSVGYRVQIFASSSLEKAEKVAGEARAVFSERVYVEYSAMLYRVRVGDFPFKEDAIQLRDRAIQSGYEGAWVAEVKVVRE